MIDVIRKLNGFIDGNKCGDQCKIFSKYEDLGSPVHQWVIYRPVFLLLLASPANAIMPWKLWLEIIQKSTTSNYYK